MEIRAAALLGLAAGISGAILLCPTALGAQNLQPSAPTTIGLELGLPGGASSQLTVVNGEAGSVFFEDAGTFGFVPRLRDSFTAAVLIEILDMRLCPTRALGEILVVAEQDAIDAPTFPAFRVRVTSISGPDAEFRRGLRLRAETDVAVPAQITRVDPVYPGNLPPTSPTGVVLVQLLISVNGDVLNARVLASVSDQTLQAVPEFEQPALDAVRQWRFAPTVVNGEAREVVMTVRVPFAPAVRVPR